MILPFLTLLAIKVVPMLPAPADKPPAVAILFPEEGEVETRQPVDVRLRLDDFKPNAGRTFHRAQVIRNNPEGEKIRVLIDNDPHFDEAASHFSIPDQLSEGQHIIRAFPVRSFGESVAGRLEARSFYIGKKNHQIAQDLDEPYLTYNEPQGIFSLSQPILLDFLISNVRLSKEGYKVRLTIDGEEVAVLTRQVPYYLYGLEEGSHSIRLELLNSQNQRVPGLFNDVVRFIKIK